MLRSWLSVDPGSHFPIQNLPFGSGSRAGEPPVLLSRVGDFAIDLEGLRLTGLLGPLWNRPLIDLTCVDVEGASRIRARLRELLEAENRELRTLPELQKIVMPMSEIEMRLPCHIPAFVDFYSGIHHASNVGKMFRPDMPPLLPNYRYVPVAYNGRASSVAVSGAKVSRPKGQIKPPGQEPPVFGPTCELDFELEMGFILGRESSAPIPVEETGRYMHGLVMVNDWSARDIQRWEYQPLGPFLAKSFATSISPWVVTMDALQPFRVHATQEPAPLAHLAERQPALYDIQLDVSLQTKKMTRAQMIARSNTRYLYWSFAQQLAHQTSNGTRVECGDLYASGTISGPDDGSFGSLLEASWRGAKPLTLAETGETRTFLEDGDVVVFTAYAQGAGYRIGFGELIGEVIGA